MSKKQSFIIVLFCFIFFYLVSNQTFATKNHNLKFNIKKQIKTGKNIYLTKIKVNNGFLIIHENLDPDPKKRFCRMRFVPDQKLQKNIKKFEKAEN